MMHVDSFLKTSMPVVSYKINEKASNTTDKLIEEFAQLRVKLISHSFPENDKYLTLEGQILVSKANLTDVLKVAFRFFNNSLNTSKQFCQVDTIPIISQQNTDSYSVAVSIEAFDPDNNNEGASYEMENVIDYENAQLAGELATASFYVSRNYEVIKIPNMYTQPLFVSGYSTIYKVLKVTTATWMVLRTSNQGAEDRIEEQFRTVNSIFAQAQSQGPVLMQTPPFSLTYIERKGALTNCSMEIFYSGGDMLDLAASPNYKNIHFAARVNFCNIIANNILKMKLADIHYTDIKLDNVLVEKSTDDSLIPHIGDYGDAIRLKKMFEVFKKVILESKLSAMESRYVETLQFIHSPSTTHFQDYRPLQFLTREMTRSIFKKFPYDDIARVKMLADFERQAPQFFEAHQVFALGVSFFSILFATPPHKDGNGYLGTKTRPLDAQRIAVMKSKALNAYPYPATVRVLKLVDAALQDNPHERPTLAHVSHELNECAVELTQ